MFDFKPFDAISGGSNSTESGDEAAKLTTPTLLPFCNSMMMRSPIHLLLVLPSASTKYMQCVRNDTRPAHQSPFIAFPISRVLPSCHHPHRPHHHHLIDFSAVVVIANSSSIFRSEIQLKSAKACCWLSGWQTQTAFLSVHLPFGGSKSHLNQMW